MSRRIMYTRRKAFTLLELLTVVGLIALLSVLLLSAIIFVRGRARLIQSGNNIRQIVVAARNYAGRETIPNSSRRGFFPSGPPQAFPIDYTAAANRDQVVIYDVSAPMGLRFRNHGWLYQRRDLDSEEAYYNPDQECDYFSNSPLYGFFDGGGQTRFGTMLSDGRTVNSSYAFRTSLRNSRDMAGNETPGTERPISTELDPSETPVVADAFTVSRSADSRLAHGNIRYSWAAVDASVRVFEDPDRSIEKAAIAGDDWNSMESNTSTGMGGVLPFGPWKLFNKGG